MNIYDVANITNSADQAQRQNHISLFYDSPEQRLEFLANYLQVGLACGELCILVTSQAQSAVEADLLSVGLATKKPLQQGDLQIFNAREAYLTNTLFVVEYMRANVANLMSDAQAQGYTGIRTVGEMSWLAEPNPVSAQERTSTGDEAQDHTLTGLCLYPISADSIADIKNTVRTDTGIIYDESEQRKALWADNLDSAFKPGHHYVSDLPKQAIKRILLGAGKTEPS